MFDFTKELGVLGSDITAIFKHMEIAEDVIKEYAEKYAEKAHIINRSFLVLKEYNVSFFQRADFVFESHCREIIQRIVDGDSLSPPTDAELIIPVMQFYTNTAPGNGGAGICYTLLNRMNPDMVGKIYKDELQKPREDWPNQFVDNVENLRMKKGAWAEQRDVEFHAQFDVEA